MTGSEKITYPIERVKKEIELDRNSVVANLVSILLKLRTRGLPEEVQQFVTGGIDNTDNESLLKIFASLSTKQAKKFYSYYIVPVEAISALEAEYYNDDAEVEEMYPTERIMSDDPEEVAQAIQKNYDRTTTGKCYYRLVVESGRNESKYAQIPYCLSEKDVAELAHALKRDPVEYQSSCMQVGPFLEYVVNKWGEFLVKNTTGRHHVQTLKLLNRS